jgi:hypothetical protein
LSEQELNALLKFAERRVEEISIRKINCLSEERASFYFSEISESLPAKF